MRSRGVVALAFLVAALVCVGGVASADAPASGSIDAVQDGGDGDGTPVLMPSGALAAALVLIVLLATGIGAIVTYSLLSGRTTRRNLSNVTSGEVTVTLGLIAFTAGFVVSGTHTILLGLAVSFIGLSLVPLGLAEDVSRRDRWHQRKRYLGYGVLLVLVLYAGLVPGLVGEPLSWFLYLTTTAIGLSVLIVGGLVELLRRFKRNRDGTSRSSRIETQAIMLTGVSYTVPGVIGTMFGTAAAMFGSLLIVFTVGVVALWYNAL